MSALKPCDVTDINSNNYHPYATCCGKCEKFEREKPYQERLLAQHIADAKRSDEEGKVMSGLPKNIFQREFIPNERDDSDIKFDFGTAIRKLKEGKKVARKGWNGSGMFVYYVPAASYPVERNNLETMGGQFPDDMVPYREYLALKTAQGDVATWAPSVSDALATDWCLA